MTIIESTIERLAWILVILVIVAEGFIIYQQRVEANQIKKGVMEIESQVSCISNYFNKPNRASLVINNLKSCDIKKQ